MGKKKPGPVADEQELLSFYTRILRGELQEEHRAKGEEELVQEPPSLTLRMKAAELLSRRLEEQDAPEEDDAFRVDIRIV